MTIPTVPHEAYLRLYADESALFTHVRNIRQGSIANGFSDVRFAGLESPNGDDMTISITHRSSVETFSFAGRSIPLVKRFETFHVDLLNPIVTPYVPTGWTLKQVMDKQRQTDDEATEYAIIEHHQSGKWHGMAGRNRSPSKKRLANTLRAFVSRTHETRECASSISPVSTMRGTWVQAGNQSMRVHGALSCTSMG